MTVTPPTLEHLRVYMGKDSTGELDSYAPQALEQALDLLLLATAIEDSPVEGTLSWRVYRNGVCQMAEGLIHWLPVRDVAQQPFMSESRGSWSYSKALADVRSGRPTGMYWFDEARRLLASDEGKDLSTSTHVFDYDTDLLFVNSEGDQFVMGPRDQEFLKQYRSSRI